MRGRRGRAAIAASIVFVVIGVIGETTELVAGGEPGSLLIGGAIIVAAAVPAVLQLRPRPAA